MQFQHLLVALSSALLFTTTSSSPSNGPNNIYARDIDGSAISARDPAFDDQDFHLKARDYHAQQLREVTRKLRRSPMPHAKACPHCGREGCETCRHYMGEGEYKTFTCA